jgi:4-amino-4-deoxy-L-arabinose transferase-like glycosyltransferase
MIALGIELGNDEVYYWTYSQRLQWNYFDHPPMVGVWIRLFTANLSLQGMELFIRLGSIVSAAAGTWLLYCTVRTIHSSRAAWFAACLYTSSLYASIIAGVFILPDSPQSLFWCGALFLLAKITRAPGSWKYWILFGVCTGLCMMSKVHGIFIPAGLALYILVQKRGWLKFPQLYVAALMLSYFFIILLLRTQRR